MSDITSHSKKLTIFSDIMYGVQFKHEYRDIEKLTVLYFGMKSMQYYFPLVGVIAGNNFLQVSNKSDF